VKREERVETFVAGFIRPVQRERTVVEYTALDGRRYKSSQLDQVGTAAVCRVIEAAAAHYGLTLRPRRNQPTKLV
jgi:hypothetical protein